ncbi:BlaI/MecI/CopY family transcriptional regulator [Polluticoccus soli]|uniref:BlaI/MecI/CopY family transcriptional regulator n=1 Tax=Polluticoccus soli TaxID=3034150 RepID=UPI0023E1547E|nr:BlaI/MecI/CopY family transcriptional regulator [Flavipsychrobacter sp. JY13-12]
MTPHFKSLTKAEEEIMQILWQLEKAFIKDVVDALPEPKPHYNTVSTIVKILEDKGFVSHESLGKSNRYFPVVAKDDYSKRSMKQFVKRYFDGSFASMLSFFAKEKDISVKELEEILNELKKSSPKK